MSKISVREAALLTGKSRETINSATNEGILSVTLNERGHKRIDIAELERVFPVVHTVGEIESLENNSSNNRGTKAAFVAESGARDPSFEIRRLASERENWIEERDRERRRFEDEIETLRTVISRLQDQQGKTLLLLGQSESVKSVDSENTVHEIRVLKSAVSRLIRENREQAEEIRGMSWKNRWWGTFIRRPVDEG